MISSAHQIDANIPESHRPERRLQQAEQAVFRAVVRAELFYEQDFPLPTVSFALRGKTAGMFLLEQPSTPAIASAKKCNHARRLEQTLMVKLNKDLLLNHTQYFMTNIIPHEVSHLVTYCLHGNSVKPHGKQWRQVMEKCFGVEANLYHDLPVDTVRAQRRPYRYVCDCDTHFFTSRRHNHYKKGYQYVCQQCRSLLRYTPSPASDPVSA